MQQSKPLEAQWRPRRLFRSVHRQSCQRPCHCYRLASGLIRSRRFTDNTFAIGNKSGSITPVSAETLKFVLVNAATGCYLRYLRLWFYPKMFRQAFFEQYPVPRYSQAGPAPAPTVTDTSRRHRCRRLTVATGTTDR